MIRCWLSTAGGTAIEALARKHPGHFILAPRAQLIARDGASVRLTPRNFRFFLMMLSRASGIVSKEEALDALYGERADGGPDDARKVLNVTAFETRTAAIALGLVLEAHHGRGWSLREAKREALDAGN